MTESERPLNFKDTLNLPRTNFDMRANSKVREPEIQQFWEDLDIYNELSKNNSGEVFTLHDGPPYANGSLHVGHALNKILKDIINKYALLNGRKARFIPGWDCHGLPIELKVLQDLSGEERLQLTAIQLRQKAREYALSQVENQSKGFQRWGIWGDWENPYLTMDKNYEAAQINVFGKMALNGHIYRGLKPVHWSPSSQTALAEAELEYPEGHTSFSIYVSFSVKDVPSYLQEQLNNNFAEDNLYLVIWTTTPWTIPANQAVSVNEHLDYAICRDTNSNYYIIASDLVESVSKETGFNLDVLLEVKGEKLVGMIYQHPLFDRLCPVVIGGDYINTENGTGLVHTAPGHGVDDFVTAQKNGLPIICTVDECGNLTEEAGRFCGLNVLKDANKIISDELLKTGALLAINENYEHSYPYDWRTKKPTIYRATEQWFASVDKFRDKVLEEINEVEWLPAIGQNRIESMVRERGDWCISRQRTWGVPIPVFYHRESEDVLMTAESLAHIEGLIKEHGCDIWWECDESVLLPPSMANEAQYWKKGSDTMDVWFDSGSSWESMSNEGTNFPVDVCLEGSDQHRGWFQSSLLTSIAVNGKAPYKSVITHGFTLDEKGRKMSKSVGNVVDPMLIVLGDTKNESKNPAYGADVLRLWVSSVDYTNDINIGPNILKQVSDVYRKVRNTFRYMLSNLYDFDPLTHSVDFNNLPLLDRWMLDSVSGIIEETTDQFNNYEFYKFYQSIQKICVSDLSNFYFDIAKDRLYVSSPDDFRRRSCQTVLYLMVNKLTSLIAPILPHLAEDIWQNLPYSVPEKSVFKNGWPTSLTKNEPLLTQAERSSVEFVRDHLRPGVNKLLENCRNKKIISSTLDVMVNLSISKNEKYFSPIINSSHPLIDNLADWLLVSKVVIDQTQGSEVLEYFDDKENGIYLQILLAGGKKCERCWHIEEETLAYAGHSDVCQRCVKVLSESGYVDSAPHPS